MSFSERQYQEDGSYRRAARRLRWHYRSNPVQLQRRLAELSRGREARRGTNTTRQQPSAQVLPQYDGNYSLKIASAPTTSGPDGTSSSQIGGQGMLSPAGMQFAELARAHIDEGVLRYDQRQRLLRLAAGLGVERFEANLVIAILQHRRRIEVAKHRPQRPSRWRASAMVAMLALAEACFVLIAVWIWG